MSVHNSNNLPTLFLMLNDDCLMKIMDQLSMSDCKSLGLTCSRIFGIFKQNPQIVYKRVELKELDDHPFCNWMHFFKSYGHYIKEINDGHSKNCNEQELFELLGVYCINLKSIKLVDRDITEKDMSKIFSKLNQLQNVELVNCLINDECMLELKHLSQLKKLNLYGNCELFGLNMKDLLPASIESLNLNSCEELSTSLLPEICKALPKLKELNIAFVGTRFEEQIDDLFEQLVRGNCCDSVEKFDCTIDTGAEEVIALLPNLKKLSLVYLDFLSCGPTLIKMLVKHKSEQLVYLKIKGGLFSETEIIMEISKLSALRTLSLYGCNQFNDPLVEELEKLKQLEEIELSCCYTVSNDAVIRLILACPKLQVLRLWQGRIITDKLLSDLIYELRLQIVRNVTQRRLPIILYLNATKVTDTMLQSSDVASKQIIHVKDIQ